VPRLKNVKLLRERVERWDEYPFSVPPIAGLDSVDITSRICFFVGENGTGKSTLLEGIAAHYGFGREGGSRNFSFETTSSVRSIDPLVRALRVGFTVRSGSGLFLRAESFFNVASYIDSVGASNSYGGRSLQDQSHGESFIASLQNRFTSQGFLRFG
jgi:predicted ATPase